VSGSRLAPWLLLLALGTACGGSDSGAPAPVATQAATGAPEVEEARGLLKAGRIDDALLRLQQSQAPEAWLLQGDAWAKKSETAPVPTAEALPPGSPKGAVPVTPEFKPEELRAIEHYEKAIAALSNDPRPRLGLARLLAPHALRRYDAERAAASAPAPKKGAKALPTLAPPPPGPDFSAARVTREYRTAAAATSSSIDPIEALYAFAVRAGQIEDAEWALKERIRRENENPEHLVRYGDFLRQVKKTPEAAMEQYRQALIWRPDDAVAKGGIADIYMDQGHTHYQNNEYALAEARYQDAAKWVTDRTSAQYKRLQAEMDRLKQLRR
jgi:hypothetical protein